LQILLHAQHVSGNTMPIIRSSRVLYRWSLPVVFANRTHNLKLHTIPTTWKPKHQTHVEHAIKSAINIICCI